jgi:hypothetical protein
MMKRIKAYNDEDVSKLLKVLERTAEGGQAHLRL